MERRIQFAKRHRQPVVVTELNLDNCWATEVRGLTEEFANLNFLSMNGCGLMSLNGLPKLPTLRELEVNDNKISGELKILLENCAQLTHLDLSRNRIKDIRTLVPLRQMMDLKVLNLTENRATQLDDYRKRVFYVIPQLEFLDGTDRNGKKYKATETEPDQGAEDDDKEGEKENGEAKEVEDKEGAEKESDDSDDSEESDLEDEEDEDGEEELGEEETEAEDDDSDSDLYDEEEEEEAADDISDKDDSALDGDGHGNPSAPLNNSALDLSGSNGQGQDGAAKDDAGGEASAAAVATGEQSAHAEAAEEGGKGIKRKLEEEEPEEEKPQESLN